MRGAEAMRKFQPDWIVAMGGGSPIDAAKAMWAFYEYPNTTMDDLIIPFNFPELRTKARFLGYSFYFRNSNRKLLHFLSLLITLKESNIL